jgi:hypothetical protein
MALTAKRGIAQMRGMLRLRRIFNGEHADGLLPDIHPAFHAYVAALKSPEGVHIRDRPTVVIVCHKQFAIV